MTDDEIEALAKKHIAPHAERLEAILPNRVPYQHTEQFRRVKALIEDVLSKLRAPVADERAVIVKIIDDLQARAKESKRHDDFDDLGTLRLLVWKASAPVAGEAVSITDEAYAALQYVEGSLAAIANRQEVVGDVIERVDTIAAAAKRAKEALSRLQAVAHYFDAAPQASEAVPHRLLAAKHVGMCVDYTGLIGQARSALKRGEAAPALAEMLHRLAVHLTELGQRWYAGDAAAVDELLQLYCIESDARAALSAQPGAQKESRDAE